MDMKYWFRNDYSFGAHPKVLEAVCAANLEGNIGYGEDKYTAKAKDRIREVCGCPDAMVEFLVGGTQTNVVACAFLLKPWEAAICPDSGHLNGHEVGGVGADGGLPWLEQKGAGHHVGLGAARQEFHHGIGAAAHLPDPVFGPGGMTVVAIAPVALQVHRAHGLQDLGVGAEGIVVAKQILFHCCMPPC